MDFLGREREIAALREPNWRGQAQLVVVYGRRRVGKTALVEHAYRDCTLWKFDGLEGLTQKKQLEHFQSQLDLWTGGSGVAPNPPKDWAEALRRLVKSLERFRDRDLVVFFDEFQWMAGMRSTLVSLFKSTWDNFLSKYKRLRVVLCGSVSSFMVKKVLRSRALYGRVSTEIDLRPLSLPEVYEFFRGRRDRREVIETAMCLGCIPQYLKELNPALSLIQNLNEYAFKPHGFFFGEYQRIFISHFGKNPTYERVLQLLRVGSKSAEALAAECGVKSGGTFASVIDDLVLAGFIERYFPLDRAHTSRDVRYRLLDEHIHFHMKFIAPHQMEILSGHFTAKEAFRGNQYQQWQGYAFERLCRRHAALIAKSLQFSGIQYKAGSWFVAPSRQRGSKARRQRSPDRGAQIDLLFERSDRMLTVCEAKYADRLDAERVVAGLESSSQALAQRYPGYGIQTVLILGKDAPVPAKLARYFDQVLHATKVFFG
jgi:hypothetical protein